MDFLAPTSRTMRTILRLVVPRTMESSTRITRLLRASRGWIELELHAKLRMACDGSMKRTAM